MTAMRYKDFIFPHNPKRIQVSYRSATATLHCPQLGSVVQHLGPRCRVVSGQGAFFGPAAAAQFAALEQLAAQGNAGYLFIPALTPFKAYLTKLVYLGEGDGSLLSYSFEFVEQTTLKGGQADYAEAALHRPYS